MFSIKTMKFFTILVVLIGLIIRIEAQDQQQPAPRVNFLQIGNIDQCEGKEVANYTAIYQLSGDANCTPGSGQMADTIYMNACTSNGQKTINSLVVLAYSFFPAGAYFQLESLFLVQSGNLQGQYVYMKEVGVQAAYLKKCSSVLGYSYTSSKGLVLLISQKLDLNIFLNPGGAFEPFKKSASTICQGSSILV